MRFAGLLVLAAGALALTGCSDLISLNPFVAEADSVADPNLAGTWKSADDDAFYIVLLKGTQYSITYTDKKDSAKFEGSLIKIGDAEIMDLIADSDDAFAVPVHLLVRVWPEGSQLRWTFLDSKWLRAQAAQLLASQASGDRTLITSQADALRSFAQKYAADPKAYDNGPTVLTRAH